MWLRGVAIYAVKYICITQHKVILTSIMRKGLPHLCSQLAGDITLEAQPTNSKVHREPPPGLVCRMQQSQFQLCLPQL